VPLTGVGVTRKRHQEMTKDVGRTGKGGWDEGHAGKKSTACITERLVVKDVRKNLQKKGAQVGKEKKGGQISKIGARKWNSLEPGGGSWSGKRRLVEKARGDGVSGG